jgi:hypothetical protein
MTGANPRPPDLERAARRAAAWTTGLLVLFVVLVAATFTLGYVQARKALDPDRLVDEGEKRIVSQYPQWREELKQELARTVPEAADRVLKQSEASLPRSRERVERYLDREVQEGLARAAAVTEADFRRFVRANRDYVRQGFADLRQVPYRVEPFAAGLEERLDKQFGVTLRQEAGVVLQALGRLNAKLEKLGRNGHLSPSEQVERRIVRTLRALQQEGAKEVARGK